ncbi:MAG: hypothetical protein QM536_00780 [Chitinophagaceae bacterium]|nr:hypothetical protein [Chitinophagaceae bacterium]
MSGADESRYIFGKVSEFAFGNPDKESFIRYFTAIMELVAAVLLIPKATSWIGAILGIGLMKGAIITHLFIIGIIPQGTISIAGKDITIEGDRGYLFLLSIICFVSCASIVFIEKRKIPIIKNFFPQPLPTSNINAT